VFSDVSQAAQENDIPESVWMDALKVEFEARFDAALIIRYPEVIAHGLARSA
jgi:hypothetical protein